MKKRCTLTLAILLLLAMMSFASAEATDNTNNNNILIAYFTMPEADGVDAVSGASRVVEDDTVIGNVEYIADVIQQAMGGDVFAIETVQTYPAIHDDLTAYAQDEKEQNACPELSTKSATWTNTTLFSSDIPTGGQICRCRCIPSWIHTIFPAKPSFPSVQMAAVDFPIR